jgi:hypothetical protein
MSVGLITLEPLLKQTVIVDPVPGKEIKLAPTGGRFYCAFVHASSLLPPLQKKREGALSPSTRQHTTTHNNTQQHTTHFFQSKHSPGEQASGS